MPTVQSLARLALKHFKKNPRDEWSVDDLAPSWLTDLVYAAHAGMMPDDFKYHFVFDALVAIDEAEGDLDAARDQLEPDIYHGRLLAWVGSSLDRAGRVDEVLEEYELKEFFSILQVAQRSEMEEVLAEVHDALQAQADEDEDEDEEEAESDEAV